MKVLNATVMDSGARANAGKAAQRYRVTDAARPVVGRGEGAIRVVVAGTPRDHRVQPVSDFDHARCRERTTSGNQSSGPRANQSVRQAWRWPPPNRFRRQL